MTFKRHHHQLLASLALFLAIMLGPVSLEASGQPSAENNTIDTSRWVCHLCPYLYGWQGIITAGTGQVSDSSNAFGNYRGLADEGGFPALDGEVRYRNNDGGFFKLKAADLGIDSRRLRGSGGKQGTLKVDFGYREIPTYRGFGTRTVYQGTGGNTLTLPGDWQTAPSTGEMGALNASLQPIDLKVSRKIFDALARWTPGKRWSFDAGYQHQSRKGTRPYGSGVLTINSSHLPVPVDFTSSRIELGLNFTGERSHWRAGFSSASFDNGQQSVTWQNPFRAAAGTEVLRTALEPDNQVHQLSLAGAWSISPGARLSASASAGRMEQDDPLLPYSINPEFESRALPRASADTRIDVGLVNIATRFSARLAGRLSLNVQLRHYERDNKTPVDDWTPVTTDLILRDPRPNRPYSFKRGNGEIGLRFRPGSLLRIQAGLEWEDRERTLQAVSETRESGYYAEAGLSPASMLDVRVRHEHSSRDGEPYVPVQDYALAEHPLMRKFNLADRKRDLLRMDIDLFFSTQWSLNLAYRYRQDDYSQSVIGLRESEERSLSLDLNWSPFSDFTVYAFASLDEYSSLQAGAENVPANPWLATTGDQFLTTGAGLTATLGQHTDIRLDLVASRARGDIDTDTQAGEQSFPQLETDLFQLRLGLDHRISDHWGIKLYLEHEDYDSSDWALDGLGPDGIPAVLTFGAESPDYKVTEIRVQGTYRF